MLTSSQWPGVLTFVAKTYVSMFLCFRLILGSSPFAKEVSHGPHYPSEITAFEPPLPLRISNDLPRGWGVWIFSGTTQLRWMKVNDGG